MKPQPHLPSTFTVHVPMKFTQRGGRKTIISDVLPTISQARTDNALLKAFARAYRWQKRIEGGEYASITELAKAERVNESYACRLLRLTLLAPSLVNQILDGRQNTGITLNQLTKPFPIHWAEQSKVFALTDGG